MVLMVVVHTRPRVMRDLRWLVVWRPWTREIDITFYLFKGHSSQNIVYNGLRLGRSVFNKKKVLDMIELIFTKKERKTLQLAKNFKEIKIRIFLTWSSSHLAKTTYLSFLVVKSDDHQTISNFGHVGSHITTSSIF